MHGGIAKAGALLANVPLLSLTPAAGTPIARRSGVLLHGPHDHNSKERNRENGQLTDRSSVQVSSQPQQALQQSVCTVYKTEADPMPKHRGKPPLCLRMGNYVGGRGTFESRIVKINASRKLRVLLAVSLINASKASTQRNTPS